MEAITKTEFDLTYQSNDVDEEEFQRLSLLALDLTELLCFGRADQKESAAKRAMKEMIAYWIDRGGTAAVNGSSSPKSERIGNYSVTNRDETILTLNGVSIAPSALVILDNAGLRNRNL